MLYKYISSSLGQNSTCISQEDFPNNEKLTRCYNQSGMPYCIKCLTYNKNIIWTLFLY